MKASSARDSFLRKVELVEAWASDGRVPEGEVCPKGPAALARWTDPARGLTAWKNPNIAAPAPSGHYPDLRARFDAAAGKLLKLSTKKSSDEVRQLKSEVQSLAEQVAVLTLEHRHMQSLVERERQLKEIAQLELAAVKAELTKIVPIR